MQIRNPKYNAFGTIDCEIEHPQFGWIPFTASIEDPEPLGAEVYQEALSIGPAPYVEPAPLTAEEVLQLERKSMRCSPLQMRKALRALGLKASVDTFLASQPEEVVEAWEYATVYERLDPLIQGAIAAMGTPEQGDELFRLARTL